MQALLCTALCVCVCVCLFVDACPDRRRHRARRLSVSRSTLSTNERLQIQMTTLSPVLLNFPACFLILIPVLIRHVTFPVVCPGSVRGRRCDAPHPHHLLASSVNPL